MPSRSDIIAALVKHVRGESLDTGERELVDSFLEDNARRQMMDQYFFNQDQLLAELEVISSISIEEGKQHLQHYLLTHKKVRRIGYRKYWWIAASLALLLTMGVFVTTLLKKTGTTETATQPIPADIKPGAFKASLTLSNGRIIGLDSLTLGELAKQGTTTVMARDGQLVYEPGEAQKGSSLYNTLTTTNGETFKTTLSDGSVIYLNAGSSITYPVSFSGNERRVTMKGEAYFSIAKNDIPFIVDIQSSTSEQQGQITVTGTQFNVNAYDDEPAVRSTLVEGRIKFAKGSQQVSVIPGTQVISTSDGLTINKDIRIEKIVAWISNDFYFDGDNIQSVMRQLSKWYNIEVAYKGTPPTEPFYGMISRKRDLQSVLQILEAAHIQYSIEGRKLTVAVLK